MAGIIIPERTRPAEYQGLESIFEYTNDDGELFLRNCGQAAAATLLTSHGLWQASADRAVTHMAHLEHRYPPDNLRGCWGTSRRCFERICAAHRLPVREVVGEEALRRELSRRNPVALMLGVSPGRFCGIPMPGGHWLVAYGYDESAVYVTNWAAGKMSWREFRHRWRSVVALLIRMRLRGLAAEW
jgi:hypothetical protein